MNADLQGILGDMARARQHLLATLRRVTSEEMQRARAGGWSVERVAQHLVESDSSYLKVLAHQCGKQAPDLTDEPPADGAHVAAMLDARREAMLSVIEGIDDETLYRLQRFGQEEYSPLSVLENIAAHDHEHAGQISALLRPAAGAPARAAAGVTVRPARPDDLPRLTEIYNHYVTETAITFDLEPWTVDARREWFSHYAETGRHRLFVADDGGRIAGYATSSKFHPRAAYDTTVEMSIFAAPEDVGRGIGGMLYGGILPALEQEDVHIAMAGVTLPNDPSIVLHERFGFTRVALLPEVGRKFGRYHDVAWLLRRF